MTNAIYTTYTLVFVCFFDPTSPSSFSLSIFPSALPSPLLSLMPRLLFAEQENSLVNYLYRFWFQYFEATVTSRQLGCEFKSALVSSKL